MKLDENFDRRLVSLLETEGHDVDTVPAEGLSGADDDAIYAACQGAERALVTLDLDFSNPFRFPPGDTEGILVVRPPRAVLPAIRATLATVLPQLKVLPLKGTLWIVEPGRIRIYDPHDEGS
jgi:predicted nuclease of predicted toxin-antitoxin system